MGSRSINTPRNPAGPLHTPVAAAVAVHTLAVDTPVAQVAAAAAAAAARIPAEHTLAAVAVQPPRMPPAAVEALAVHTRPVRIPADSLDTAAAAALALEGQQRQPGWHNSHTPHPAALHMPAAEHLHMQQEPAGVQQR